MGTVFVVEQRILLDSIEIDFVLCQVHYLAVALEIEMSHCLLQILHLLLQNNKFIFGALVDSESGLYHVL